MRVRLAAPARDELREARRYYEREHAGLGSAFAEAVQQACARIGGAPRLYPVERDDVRKCSLDRFPYKLLYAERAGGVVVLAVAHHRRKPDYWTDRLPRPTTDE